MKIVSLFAVVLLVSACAGVMPVRVETEYIGPSQAQAAASVRLGDWLAEKACEDGPTVYRAEQQAYARYYPDYRYMHPLTPPESRAYSRNVRICIRPPAQK